MCKFINKSTSLSLQANNSTMSRHSLGVRTRAQSLAFQRLSNSSAAGSAVPPDSGADYLQLRSRLLLRVSTETRRRKQSRSPNQNPNPSLIVTSTSPPVVAEDAEEINNESQDDEIEASTGESVLEFEGGGSSSTRENTSSSRSNSDSSSNDSEAILAPRPPTAKEIDDFLTAAENELNDDFIAKYNFDPMNEMPLPGRYEWVKVNP